VEKRFLQLVALIIAIIVVWQVWHPLWRMDLNEAVNPKDTEKVTFTVASGSSARTIADDLKNAKLIVNEKSFLRTLETEGLDQNLRSGSFRLSPSMTLRDVITILTEGNGEMVVTIPEGWTIREIDTHLTELGLIQEGEFSQCALNCEFEYDFLEDVDNLEGFLFPDTYFVDSGNFVTRNFIDKLLSNFDQKLTPELRQGIKDLGKDVHDVIIVASMIEREVFTEGDIPIVSGIIWKRLRNSWPLGIDATLLYVQDDNVLTAEDLQMDTRYNTRLYQGLPPTAISNPGIASIEGAIYPEDSEYWFYLNTLDTGEVIYAVTNAEHETNKDLYL
jgi:UPF0755 protein